MNDNQNFNNNFGSPFPNNLNTLPIEPQLNSNNDNSEANNNKFFNTGANPNTTNLNLDSTPSVMNMAPSPNPTTGSQNTVGLTPTLNNPLGNQNTNPVNTGSSNVGMNSIDITKNYSDELAMKTQLFGEETNQFINNSSTYNETSLSDLNVDGAYNRLEKNEDNKYINDPKVRENIENHNKKTIPITKELKTIFIIVAIMLVFIFVMPSIFDAIRNIKYN